MKICLFDGVSESAVAPFREAGYDDIELFPDSLPEPELIQKVAEADAIGLRSKTKLPAEILKHATKLRCIGRYGIGVNNVDLAAAKEQEVAVFNGPFSSTRSVAEMVIGAIFVLFRQTVRFDRQLQSGYWKKATKGSREIRGKTLGLVGYGNISSQVSIMAEALGMRVLFYEVRPVLTHGNAQAVDFETLLRESDVVSLHVPLLSTTEKMMNAKTFAKMKEGACLINLARGEVVDVDALAATISSGHLGGACVDVFPGEPKGEVQDFTTLLQGLPNVILTPHVGGATEEAQKNLGREVSDKMVACLKTGSTAGSIV